MYIHEPQPDHSDQHINSSVQEGKTAFYEGLIDRNLEYRSELISRISWLHPIARVSLSRKVSRVDTLLSNLSETVQQSRVDDIRLAEQQIAELPQAQGGTSSEGVTIIRFQHAAEAES